MRLACRLAFLGLAASVAHCNNSTPPPPEPQTPSPSSSTGSASETVQTTPPANASAMPPTDPTPGTHDPAPAATGDALARLAKDSNAFGFDLYQRVRAQKGNLVVSPASITTALSMAWGGAKGDTADQMKKALHFDGTQTEVMQAAGKLSSSLTDPSRPIKFRIANRLFGEKTYKFEPAYLETTKVNYGAPLEAVDFIKGFEPARARINGWVEDQTEKRIKNLIPPNALTKDTRLVLVNAIYFLGDWQSPFDKESTKPGPFQLTATSKKDVPTMHNELHVRYAEQNGVKAVELPYKGNNMSMLVVVPDKVDGLEPVEKSLDNAKLDGLVSALKSETVNVSLPKFEINPAESLSLGDRLKEMGMVLAFDRTRADFTGMANPPSPEDRLYISKVFHKAFIRVDEKGTEAAAATATVMMRATSMPLKVVSFKADHPFLFFIRDNATGMILFSGRVADPSAK
ncbi:serpin family protein [Pendulispora albinea]|uniref:Serpin family protein n=1 Tax=Pendulispora albinea TaxID=2741071 RepID=A0ABZ2M7Z3_9BACT